MIQARLAAPIDRQCLLAVRRRAEVEWSALHGCSLAGWDHIDDWEIGIGVHLQHERVDFGLEISGHVPVGVVSHVDHGAACGSSLVLQLQLVPSVQREGDVHLHHNREMLGTVTSPG